jgi:hypothetical protein
MTEVAPLMRVTDRRDLLVEGWDVVDVIKEEEGLDGVHEDPSTQPMSLSAAILLIFLASHQLRGLVVDHLVVVDPASNHLGWYGWSLLVTAFRWQWWVGLLLHPRPTGPRLTQWVLLIALLAVDAYPSYDSRYSKLIYGTALSVHGHQAMMALHTLLSIGQSTALLLLAFVVSRRAYLLPVMIFISALKIFIIDLPTPVEPFLREVISSGLPSMVYIILASAVFIYLRGSSDREDLEEVAQLGSSRRSPRSTAPPSTP